ncbi:MAG: 3-keto-5-aminohexanoate cleavage protein, partial [Actinomycetota bacterium]
MPLADQTKVAIEVGLNETERKAANPNIPYGPGEIAASAIEAARAGGAIIHYHARTETGDQAFTDPEPSRRALEAIAREVDVLAYPSYREARLEHVWALSDDPPAGFAFQMSPFDVVQHVRRASWDEATKTFGVITYGPTDEAGSRPAYPPELDEFVTRGLVPNIAIFNSGDLRWTVLAARAGLLKQPLNLKLFFSERWVSMNAPTTRVLDFLIGEIPTEIDYEAIVVPYAMDGAKACEGLWNAALERGLGVRVGIGDCPRAFPTATNAELVHRVAELAGKHGRTSATANEVRVRCGLPTLA